MPILDEDFAARLESVPDPKSAVDELVTTARRQSEARVFLAAIDFEIMTYNQKRFLTCEMRRHWIVQQFAAYFGRVASRASEIVDPEDQDFVRRLQMLAYSQLWECLGVQRLLRQLACVANGQEYDARMLLDSRSSTYVVFQGILQECGKLELQVESFLRAVYHNQIRNAFSHSEIWFLDEWISFQNFDSKKDNHIPSLKTSTWDKLFLLTTQFTAALFTARRNLESELHRLSPFKVDLPNLCLPFLLDKDKRGYWNARPVG